MKASLILTAAGESSRFGAGNKCLAQLNDQSLLTTCLKTFLKFDWVDIIVTAHKNSIKSFEKDICKYLDKVSIIEGGATRKNQ